MRIELAYPRRKSRETIRKPGNREKRRGGKSLCSSWIPGLLILISLPCGLPVDSSSAADDAFSLPSLMDIDGRTLELSASEKAPAVLVLAWTGSACPMARLYLPRLEKLAKDFAPRGVWFLLVNSNSYDDLASIRRATAGRPKELAVVRDGDGKLARLLGARSTTEVFVLDGRRRVVYRGAADDQYGYRRAEGLGARTYRKEAPTRHHLRDAVEAALAGRTPPVARTDPLGCALEWLPAPDGPASAKAKRSLTFHEHVEPILQEQLLKNANRKREALLTVIEEVSKGHVEFTRQSARVFASLGYARKLTQDGTLAGWNEPQDASNDVVWDEWRRRQVAELDRLELAGRIRAGVVAAKDIEAMEARLATERENLKRAEANLATEVSYAEFVAKMEDQSNEQLLALLAPDGEIARKLSGLATATEEVEKRIAQATAKGREAVRSIQTLENPYSQAALRKLAENLPKIRQELESLEEGKPYPDESSKFLPEKKPVDFSLIESRGLQKGELTAVKLANEESRYLVAEQQFAREFLAYFDSLKENLGALRVAVEERHAADAQHETQLDALIREEKRRYAAALQIRRRLEQGRLDASKAPKDLDRWLSRTPIIQATETLRTARRESSTLRARADYEIDRLEKLTVAADWIRIRSEAADERVRLSGRPVAHLSAALTPLKELNDVERQHLTYDAKAMESDEEPAVESILERFTDPEERQRFEEPLATYYLELADTRRVRKNLMEAEQAYREMAANCVGEKERLLPLRDHFEKSIALRLSDYHAARYTVAIVAHPTTRARMEESFRKEYGRDLPYRLNFDPKNRDLAAELLFGAQARLVADRSIARDAAYFLSKLGLDQEIG